MLQVALGSGWMQGRCSLPKRNKHLHGQLFIFLVSNGQGQESSPWRAQANEDKRGVLAPRSATEALEVGTVKESGDFQGLGTARARISSTRTFLRSGIPWRIQSIVNYLVLIVYSYLNKTSPSWYICTPQNSYMRNYLLT